MSSKKFEIFSPILNLPYSMMFTFIQNISRFLVFSVSLLDENQFSALNNSSFALLNKSGVFAPEIWNVQSYGNRRVKQFVEVAKSLMKNENYKGPRQMEKAYKIAHSKL